MVEIRLARATDAAAIGDLFSRAFARDPVTSWVTSDPVRRERVLSRLNAAIVRHEGVPHGATYVAEDQDAILGAEIWRPPGPLPPNWRSVPFALLGGLALGRDMGRMITMGRAAARARPRQRHWYLQLLGVDPEAQHAGVGRALVETHLLVVDRQKLPAYLETTVENVPFYEGVGFRVTGEIRAGRGAPREYSLLRDAQ
jgi:ribosomal protein S18 acetylase RimI-like enzyme